jgi:hypothetical protein
MNKVLATGGSGFLGRQVIKQLEHQDITCAALDNVEPRCGADPNFPAINVDITDFHQLENIIVGIGFDTIIHLAAYGRNLSCQDFAQRAYPQPNGLTETVMLYSDGSLWTNVANQVAPTPPTLPDLANSGFTDDNTSLTLKVIGAQTFGTTGGEAFSVSLSAGSSQTLTITQAAILATLSGQTTVISSTPLTYKGQSTWTIAESATTTTDEIPYQTDSQHDYYVVIYTDNASSLGILYGSSSDASSNVQVSSQSSGNNCNAASTSFFSQDGSYWRVFSAVNFG